MVVAASGPIANSVVLGAAVVLIAIVVLCAAEIMDLQGKPGPARKLAFLMATLTCVVALALVVNRFAVFG
jgi:Ca2+/Na+ antiporter